MSVPSGWLENADRVRLRIEQVSLTAKQLGHSMSAWLFSSEYGWFSRCSACGEHIYVTPHRVKGLPTYIECKKRRWGW